jgi:hypothetical protein
MVRQQAAALLVGQAVVAKIIFHWELLMAAEAAEAEQGLQVVMQQAQVEAVMAEAEMVVHTEQMEAMALQIAVAVVEARLQGNKAQPTQVAAAAQAFLLLDTQSRRWTNGTLGRNR